MTTYALSPVHPPHINTFDIWFAVGRSTYTEKRSTEIYIINPMTIYIIYIIINCLELITKTVSMIFICILELSLQVTR